MTRLEPGEAGPKMFRDAKLQAILLGCLLPIAYHITLWPHVHGIPFVDLRIPEVEIVVVGTHAHEVACTRFFVKRHEAIGIPFLGLPQGNDVLVAVLGWMPVCGQVMFILPVPRYVHMFGVPVAFHRYRLGAPVCPDTELGVPKPSGALILLERFHVPLEWSIRDRRRLRRSLRPGYLSQCYLSQQQGKNKCMFHRSVPKIQSEDGAGHEQRMASVYRPSVPRAASRVSVILTPYDSTGIAMGP